MTATAARGRRKDLARFKGVVLDIGCGFQKEPGAVGMDARDLPGVDIVHDWNRTPWPFEDGSVLTILAEHAVEHVSRTDDGMGFVRWMNECWRILKPGRQMLVTTPYAGSPLYYADPTHLNPCTERTWWYFAPEVTISQDGQDRRFYEFYEPAPWHIEHIRFPWGGMMSLVLRKMADRADWHRDGQVHYGH
jgi:SAM-dependent methyltransferase